MRKSHQLIINLLALGVFGIINTEMGVVSTLSTVTKLFGVSLSTAGLLVSGFALGVAAAGPTMPLLFSKVNRKTAMVISLEVFILGNVVSIFTHSFTVLMVARIIPAFFQPVYTATAFSMAASLVDKGKAQQAVAQVFIGVSAGMVLGVPITNFIVSHYSFAAAMAFFALVNALVLVMTMFIVPSMPVDNPVSYGDQVRVLKKPAMWVAIVLVMMFNGSVFGFFSYLADFLATVTHLSANAVSAVLMVYGLANIVGNIIAGRVLSTHPRDLIRLVPVLAFAAYFALFLTGNITALALIILTLIGIISGLINNADQYLINSEATTAPDFANGLFLTAANLGTTIGTAFCGAMLSHFNTRFALVSSLCMLVVSFGLVTIQQKISSNHVTD